MFTRATNEVEPDRHGATLFVAVRSRASASRREAADEGGDEHRDGDQRDPAKQLTKDTRRRRATHRGSCDRSRPTWSADTFCPASHNIDAPTNDAAPMPATHATAGHPSM